MAREDDDPEEAGDHRRAREPSPARAKAPKEEAYEDPIDRQARQAESIDDRVLVIAYLLTQGRWTKLKTLQYSNLWACSIETVRSYAKDAARFMRLMAGSKSFKAHVREIDAQLRTAFELAIAQGDAKGAVAAAKARGELHGVFAPKKIANTDVDGKALPPAPPMPPQVAVFVNNEAALRFWAATGRRPTPAQVAQLEAGVPPEEVARSAGLLQGLPSRS